MSTDFLFELWSLELFKDINVCTVYVLFSVTVSVLYSVILSPRGQAGLEAKFCPRLRRTILGLGLEHLQHPGTFYFVLVKMSVVMELVITVSCQ